MSKMPFSITFVTPDEPTAHHWDYGTVWEGVEEIHIRLGDAHWYGGGALINQHWPLEKIAMYNAPFITSDNGHSGLLGTLEPLWWTSTGAGLWVENDELEMSFNAPFTGEPPSHSFQDPAFNDLRPILASRVASDGLLKIRGENLTLYFFDVSSPREVVEAFWRFRGIGAGLRNLNIPISLLEKPLWTTWAHFKNHISHEKLMDHIQKLQHYGFGASVFGIDAKWQQQFGDTQFDPQKFPLPSETVQAIHALGAEATLWCVPFFMQDSMHFEEANRLGYTIRRTDGTPYIGEWWEGKAAFLDISNRDALDWHLKNLRALKDSVGIDSFKFDAGEAMFYMAPDTVRQAGGAPNLATHTYVDEIAPRFPWSDLRSAWRNQGQPMLFRQWDKSTSWGFDNGLASCITQAITLNMIGYPINFPDMIGGNEYGNQCADGELMIRWTQAVAPMPLIQFSIPPWRFGDECAALCKRYADLHAELAPRHAALIKAGEPIIRPLWWIAPHDENALVVDDQYLVGDSLMVAPIISSKTVTRDIYFPEGRWQCYWDSDEIIEGGQWIRDYPAPLECLPLFERLS